MYKLYIDDVYRITFVFTLINTAYIFQKKKIEGKADTRLFFFFPMGRVESKNERNQFVFVCNVR